MSSLAVCPGSYDPITLGHLDIVRRALTFVDGVVIGVANNPAKKYLFPLEQRVALARAAVAELGLSAVTVEPVEGLLADYVRERGITAIVKGLRGSADLDGEQAMALLNRQMCGVETVFVMGDQSLSHIASSYVKEIFSHGAGYPGLVPQVVAQALVEAYEGGS